LDIGSFVSEQREGIQIHRKKGDTMKMYKMITASTLLAVLIWCVSATAQQPTVQARVVKPVAVEGDLADLPRTLDGLETTRAFSTGRNYAGMSVTADLGGEQNIIGVIQDHGRWPTHYPASYRVEVGRTASGPWLRTFEGPGTRGENKAIFEAVRGRFIRVTATSVGNNGPDWSIAEFKAIIDPGQRPRPIPGDRPTEPEPPTRPAPPARPMMKNIQLAFDRDQRTRATTETPEYTGMIFDFDLGGEYQLSRVVQLHGEWRDDYPAQYKVEVSRESNESRFREVWRGAGEPGRSVARFTEVTTRYVRITALRNRDRVHWWTIAELRTNRDPEVVEDEEGRDDRIIRNITGRGLTNLNAAIDDDLATFATTGRGDYTGNFLVLDLGGSYTISRVIQIHDPRDRDFPGRYRVEVSDNGRLWREVFEGAGESGRSRAVFTPVRARYVRITATSARRGDIPWSITRVRVSG
jgi:hypothetical protein